MNRLHVVFASLLFLLFAAGTSLSGEPTETRNTEALRWRLTQLESGEIEWEGELPPARLRQMVPWSARAVWTSADDAATTVLLADTGRLLTEYRPRHRLPLSLLAPPPGPGTIDLEFSTPNDPPVKAQAVYWGMQLGFQEYLADARREARQLREEIVIAGRYGVRRPEAGSLLTIMDIYMSIAETLDSESSSRSTWAQWWFGWLNAQCREEKELLVQARNRPEDWRIVNDPPLQDLRVDPDRGIQSHVWSPAGGEWQTVCLAGIRGQITSDDLILIKRLGFNVVDPEQTTTELATQATRLNLVLREELPAEAQVRVVTPGEPFAPKNRGEVLILEGWEGYDDTRVQPLANFPKRLVMASGAAWRWRTSEHFMLSPGFLEPCQGDDESIPLIQIRRSAPIPPKEYWDDLSK